MVNFTDVFPFVHKTIKWQKYDKTGWDEVFEPTYTSDGEAKRLIIEWSVNTTSILLNLILCIFLWRRKKLMLRYLDSITFITLSAQILSWPFYILTTWQTFIILLGRTPQYSSILHCTLLRHFVNCCFQSTGLNIVPIAINRLRQLLGFKTMGFAKLTMVQIVITFAEFGFTLGHLAIGNVTFNDMCAKWIASRDVFLIHMILSHTLLTFTIVVNLVPLLFYLIHRKNVNNSQNCSTNNSHKYSYKNQNTNLMYLTQAVLQVFLTLPLSLRQIRILLKGKPATNFIRQYGYMLTFSTIFLVPFVSMMFFKDFRSEFTNLRLFSYSKRKEASNNAYSVSMDTSHQETMQ